MVDEVAEKTHENDASQNVKSTDILAGTLLLSGVTFASMAGGFGYAIGQARKRSPSSFDQRQQEGAKLAMRALGWGTIIAVSGFGLLIFGVKTALGVKDAKEFGLKMKSIFPTKDGKLVSYFEHWRIPRDKGKGNSEEWWSSETHATEERR